MPNVEADLEVLKSELAGLHRAVDAFGAKIDLMMQMQVQLVQVQEQHATTRAGLDRAFTAIKNLSEKHDDERLNNRSAIAMIRGMAIASVFFLGGLQWYAKGQIEDVQRAVKDLATVDRRLSVLEREVGFFQRPKGK